ncbi:MULTISPECIES: twin-arginine translocase subunit TatC [unclassified Nitratiruptor]|uniref:twin-arginine translocase subunit TatC n=1 Tax=unclassified Nitratiruptor TaxID=2624044 RepID=UPI0019162C70|nr:MULTISPECIES: twin-arginine translocase subunit TatC [unclassified Nitratiruptor]BCD60132.1 sec-independent protein translocase protein TatC [Nitratiruptor sp. YY08-10]BCD64379.1 sec-independent protein translocase protein TatC [Nitratiruptor sp. YY08-14]
MFEELKPHLAELRKRLLIIIATLFVMFVICFGFWEHILDWMIMPLKQALPPGSNVIFTKVGEAFFTALKVSFFASLIVSLPVIFWQLWLFIAPGLYEHEKKLVLPFVIAATGMFVTGALFAYYVVFPFGFSYLINFGSQLFTALPSIGEYVGFFTKLMIGFGIAFELPVITFFLAKLGLVTDESLKSFFKYAIIIIFLVAALLTPPDVLSQLLMAGPLVILYGVSILIAKIVNPAQPEEEIEESE